MPYIYALFAFKRRLFLSLFIGLCFWANANTYYVTLTADTGLGSLRAAIDSSNANPGLDSILLQLSVHDTIYLSGPLPIVTDSLFISGRACQNPTITGGGAMFNGSVLRTGTAALLTINYLNFINCYDTAANAQGAAVKASHLWVNHCYFAFNTAKPQTGTGKGGAVYSDHIWIYSSSFYRNKASNKTNSNGDGGALNSSSRLYMNNCTFDGNNSSGPGGAMLLDSAVISNCTFTNNSAGTVGGALGSSDSISISNSIIWNNTAASYPGLYFPASVISRGCNILQTSGADFNFNMDPSDISGVDPLLDTLGYFNGCVPVVPIFCGSVAQDHANCLGATAADAEDVPAYGTRDAGAFEITPPYIGGDTIDSIQPGATVDLVALFNTTGLSIHFSGSYTDSTQADTGTYTIVATNYLGCSDTAIAIIRYSPVDTVIDTLTSVKNVAANNAGIMLFPNPASDRVNVGFASIVQGPMQVYLTDAVGGVLNLTSVSHSGVFSVDVSGFNSGLYYVQITDACGNRYCEKLNVIRR